MPARKRRSRTRSSRRRVPQRAAYLVSFSILLALVVVTVQVCKRSKPPKTSTTASRQTGNRPARSRAPSALNTDRGQVAARYDALIARAGGDRAWVKRAARPADPHQSDESHTAAAGEVLLLGPASGSIVAALQREAVKDRFRLEIQAGTNDAASRIRSVSLWRGDEQICAWRLREVPRLYRASIVIDDLGQEMRPARELLRVPYPLTFSILPRLAESEATAAAAHQSGREVMLHLPMEPLATGMSPGPGAIRVGMPGLEVDRVIESDLASVPYVAGVNNHMGSRATSDPALMGEVMRDLAGRKLYFIDSRTAGSTVAFEAARRAGIPAFYRSVFLDDTESVDYTLGQLRRLRAAVQSQGVALAIGHPHPSTIAALESFLPALERDDVELVPASRLVGLSESARLSPPPSGNKGNGD